MPQESEYLSTDPNWGRPMRTETPPASSRWFVGPSQQAREEGTRTDYDRPDNSLLGLPPELAVTSGLGIGRAAASEGLTTAGRVYAGGKEALGQAAPAVKYEITRTVLQGMGVPPAVAMPIAIAASGYRRGAKPTPTAKTAAPAAPVAPASPAVSSPEVPVPAAVSGAPVSAPVQPVPRALSPQRIQNELGIAARRQQVALTEPQYKAATALVAQGKSPAEAVTEIASRTAAATPAATAATMSAGSPAPMKTPKGSSRAKLSADEADEYLRLLESGKTHDEAVGALMQQRQLAAKLGTPSPDSVRRRVAERNATGRWPEGRK
jgi:hypothetical protein